MADITLLQGRASRVSQNATVLRTGTTWQTIQVAQFLIDDTPAKFAGSPHLNEGDGATVVGHDFRPDFRVLAMRNSVLGSLARGTVGVVGLLLALVALIGCAAILTSLLGGSDDRTSSILGLVFCLGVTATGFYLVRFGFGPRLRKRAGQTQLAR